METRLKGAEMCFALDHGEPLSTTAKFFMLRKKVVRNSKKKKKILIKSWDLTFDGSVLDHSKWTLRQMSIPFRYC